MSCGAPAFVKPTSAPKRMQLTRSKLFRCKPAEVISFPGLFSFCEPRSDEKDPDRGRTIDPGCQVARDREDKRAYEPAKARKVNEGLSPHSPDDAGSPCTNATIGA